jgi:uncharacterized membrane protein YeaQ/YmgE (transglycosylase-associated protein family)
VHPVFLAFVLDPGGVFAWILVGLIAGAVAGRVVRGRGYGCLVDILVGIAGAFIGGALLGGFIHGVAGFWESLVVALIGAIVLLAALRLITGSRG